MYYINIIKALCGACPCASFRPWQRFQTALRMKPLHFTLERRRGSAKCPVNQRYIHREPLESLCTVFLYPDRQQFRKNTKVISQKNQKTPENRASAHPPDARLTRKDPERRCNRWLLRELSVQSPRSMATYCATTGPPLCPGTLPPVLPWTRHSTGGRSPRPAPSVPCSAFTGAAPLCPVALSLC